VVEKVNYMSLYCRALGNCLFRHLLWSNTFNSELKFVILTWAMPIRNVILATQKLRRDINKEAHCGLIRGLEL